MVHQAEEWIWKKRPGMAGEGVLPRVWLPFLISGASRETAAREGVTLVDEVSLTFSLTLNTEIL